MVHFWTPADRFIAGTVSELGAFKLHANSKADPLYLWALKVSKKGTLSDMAIESVNLGSVTGWTNCIAHFFNSEAFLYNHSHNLKLHMGPERMFRVFAKLKQDTPSRKTIRISIDSSSIMLSDQSTASVSPSLGNEMVTANRHDTDLTILRSEQTPHAIRLNAAHRPVYVSFIELSFNPGLVRTFRLTQGNRSYSASTSEYSAIVRFSTDRLVVQPGEQITFGLEEEQSREPSPIQGHSIEARDARGVLLEKTDL